MSFAEQLKADIALIEPALEKYLSRETGEGYDRIFEAAKYSAMAGGKRLRPVIVLEFCRLCGGDVQQALPFACALEMIHTYSLIHDDLPCMDNDDLRRGRPTCHKAFDEATAVLAGDGLLTAAFETASAAEGLPAETVLQCIRILGRAAGMNGMIAGQVLDMGAEHRKITLDELRLLQSLKTGCLLWAACELGCVAAGKTTRIRCKKRTNTAKSSVSRSRSRTISWISRATHRCSARRSARMRATRSPPSRPFWGWRSAAGWRTA